MTPSGNKQSAQNRRTPTKYRSNQLASEKIYAYFSKHAGLHDMDENLFEVKINEALEKAKTNLKAKVQKVKTKVLKKMKEEEQQSNRNEAEKAE